MSICLFQVARVLLTQVVFRVTTLILCKTEKMPRTLLVEHRAKSEVRWQLKREGYVDLRRFNDSDVQELSQHDFT